MPIRVLPEWDACSAFAFESRITRNYLDFAEWVSLSSLPLRSGWKRIIRFFLETGDAGDSVSGAIANCTRAVIVFLLLTHILNICYLVRGDGDLALVRK